MFKPVTYSFFFLESLQERALEEGVLDMLEQYISYHLSDRSLCNMVLLTVSSFADSGKISTVSLVTVFSFLADSIMLALCQVGLLKNLIYLDSC